jgi:hypothetical protein
MQVPQLRSAKTVDKRLVVPEGQFVDMQRLADAVGAVAELSGNLLDQHSLIDVKVFQQFIGQTSTTPSLPAIAQWQLYPHIRLDTEMSSDHVRTSNDLSTRFFLIEVRPLGFSTIESLSHGVNVGSPDPSVLGEMRKEEFSRRSRLIVRVGLLVMDVMEYRHSLC